MSADEGGSCAVTGTTIARQRDELHGDRENPPTFDSPGNIVFMPVDRNSGEPAGADSGAVVNEAFISGTQPIKQ